jgi:futalosine hydrolase
MVSESRDHAQLKYERFKADVETMEGAALFYLAMMEQVPVLQIRAVSNRVGDRDPDHWNVPLAANRLAAVVLQYLDALEP